MYLAEDALAGRILGVRVLGAYATCRISRRFRGMLRRALRAPSVLAASASVLWAKPKF